MSSPKTLLHTFETTLKKRQQHNARRKLTLTPHDSVDFSSNDFLSLSHSSALRSAYLREFNRAAHVALGSGGSRLLDGNCTYAEELEQDIATFHNAPSGLLFNSGYAANSGFFSCIPQNGDVIVYDEFIHASVHEGMRLSRAGSLQSFSHNSITDFRRLLKTLIQKDEAIRAGKRNIFIALESVYSMDGDVAPIVEMLDIVDEMLPEGNGHVIVDEAHSTGVYEPSGRGIVCQLGVEDRILARLHTFGKALSSGGAILLCHPTVREYLINYAKSLIYTTALGLPTLAMIRTVYSFMKDGGAQYAQEHLWKLIHHFHYNLSLIPSTPLIQVSHESPKSPIFSVCTPYPRSLAKHCQERGFVVRPIVPPTVPEGGSRVRVCLHSANTEDEVDRLIQAIVGWLEKSSGSSVTSDLFASDRSRLSHL